MNQGWFLYLFNVVVNNSNQNQAQKERKRKSHPFNWKAKSKKQIYMKIFILDMKNQNRFGFFFRKKRERYERRVKVTNLQNVGWISADRGTRATLMRTIPSSLFKSSTKDLSLPIFELVSSLVWSSFCAATVP